jgi:hypothetical protein
VNGLGGELQFVASKVYDPETGLLAASPTSTGPDLIVFVGKKRLDPGGTLVSPPDGELLPAGLPHARRCSRSIAQLKDDHDT